MLNIIFVSVILSLTYSILIKQGELLQGWARFVNLTIRNKFWKKLLICPHCVAGQIALWSSVYFLDIQLIMSVPLSILITYVLNKFL